MFFSAFNEHQYWNTLGICVGCNSFILYIGIYLNKYRQVDISFLLGFLQALLKARNILNEDFGNVHMYFGEPISIRQYTTGKIDRSVHSLAPRQVLLNFVHEYYITNVMSLANNSCWIKLFPLSRFIWPILTTVFKVQYLAT